MPSTVADVLVDGLARSGIARLFTAGPPDARIAAAARGTGLMIVEVGAPATACLLAAVTGELGESPGLASVADPGEAAVGLRYAADLRAPMLVIAPESSTASSLVKGVTTLTPRSAAHGTAHAIQFALGRPRGGVQIVLAPEIVDRPALPVATTVRPPPLPPPDPGALDDAARRLTAATRPILIVGLECRDGDVPKWVRPLAETLPAPVLVTTRARGVVPDPHPLNLGTVGEGDALLTRADLVVMVGVDALEPVWPASHATVSVVHLGATPFVRTDCVASAEVVGDVSLIIEELAPRLRGRSRADWDIAEVARLKRQIAHARRSETGATRVVAIAREATPAGAIAAADRGLWEAAVAGAWPTVGPGELLVPGQSGPASFAVVAALAAQLARPDRRVLAFADAPGLAEDALRVIARLGAAITVVLLGPSNAGAGPVVPEDLGMPVVSAATESALARELTAAGTGPSVIDARGGPWSPPV